MEGCRRIRPDGAGRQKARRLKRRLGPVEIRTVRLLAAKVRLRPDLHPDNYSYLPKFLRHPGYVYTTRIILKIPPSDYLLRLKTAAPPNPSINISFLFIEFVLSLCLRLKLPYQCHQFRCRNG